MAGSNPGRRGFRRKKVIYHDDWFRPEALFRHGQPYSTLMRYYPGMIEKAIKESIPEHLKIDALEIGPGNKGVISKLGFRSYVHLDVSEGVIRSWANSMLPKAQNSFVLGRLERLPFGKGSFGLAVANEVLMYVLPKNRKAAVKSLANCAGRVILTDRVYTGPKRTDYDLSNFVNPRLIEKWLSEEGFSCRISYYENPAEYASEETSNAPPFSYFVIFAEKRKGAK